MAAQHSESRRRLCSKSRLALGFENAEKLGAIIGAIVADDLIAFRPRPSRDPLAMERVRATGAGGTFYTLLMCIDGQ